MIHALALSLLLGDAEARSISTLAALEAVDMVTTRKIQSYGGHEQNPLAHPFVSSNGGAILYFGASVLVQDAVVHMLPKSWRRPFMTGSIMLEVVCNANNLHNISVYRGR
jgi:hypothetical protein